MLFGLPGAHPDNSPTMQGLTIADDSSPAESSVTPDSADPQTTPDPPTASDTPVITAGHLHNILTTIDAALRRPVAVSVVAPATSHQDNS